MTDASAQAQLRALPSIDELLLQPEVKTLLASFSRPVALTILRAAVSDARERALAGQAAPFSVDDVNRQVLKLGQPNLKRVINATGVVLHTNLGRAPLAKRAVERIAATASGYTNLEIDLDEGERGSRYAPVVELLKSLTGAEDALVVNNCAAAVLLTLSALGQGRQAIVSRGELVEIGGGFRVPDVMKQSGVSLIEVGTTNRTRLADFETAVTDATALLVKVHQSNFAIQGFTEAVTARELAQLAREKSVVSFCDLGSGLLSAIDDVPGFPSETTVKSVISAGIDVVAFSGDKLLGGPQAGIVVGKKTVLEKLKKHPLNRALRIDKMTVAALEATLEIHRDGLQRSELPTHVLLHQPPTALKTRAETLQTLLSAQSIQCSVQPCVSRVGGGTLPLAELPSFAVVLAARNVEVLHQQLRAGSPAVVARVSDDALLFDVRCVSDHEVDALAASIASASRRS